MAARQVISATELPISDPLDEASDLMFGRPLGYIEGEHLDKLRYSASAPLNHAMGDAYPPERYVIFDDKAEPVKGDVVFAYVTLRRRGNEFEEAQISETNGWDSGLTCWERQVIRRFDTNTDGKILLSPDNDRFQGWVEGPMGDDFVVEITIQGCATHYTPILEDHVTVHFSQFSVDVKKPPMEAAKANGKRFEASSWDGNFTYNYDMTVIEPTPETHFALRVLDRSMWGNPHSCVKARWAGIHVQGTPQLGDNVLVMEPSGDLFLAYVGSEGLTNKFGQLLEKAGSIVGVVSSHADSFVELEAA